LKQPRNLHTTENDRLVY